MTAEPGAEPLQALLTAFREGDPEAGARLMERLYPELRRLATRYMRGERREHSWQPTLLVHELYLELMKVEELRPSESNLQDEKAAFFGLAGQIMRRLLIHHARPLSQKALKVPVFEEARTSADSSSQEVEQLLKRLAGIKPVLRTVVEMKVFEGSTAEEIAGQLGCAPVTVHRHWQFARHWLQREWGR